MAIEVWKVASVVAGYWTASISMVFANKYLVGGKLTDDISLFVSWFQCLVTVFIIVCIDAFVRIRSGGVQRIWISSSLLFSPPVLAMACFFICMLSFNNMCLKLVGVSFYQVARSTTIIFVVIFSAILLHKYQSRSIIFCCLLVAGGFILGVDQEKVIGSLSIRGVVFGVLSSVFIALTAIYTKKALEVVDKNELRLTLCTNIVASIGFIPVVLLTGQMSSAFNSKEIVDPFFWFCLLLTGVLGCLMAWISAKQINVTSPVTHHISANAKAVAQTLIAVVYFQETKTALWWVSILMVVIGALAYAVTRMREESHIPKTGSKVAVNGNGAKLSDTDVECEKRILLLEPSDPSKV